MIRERYFKELAIVLQKEGFTPLPEQEQRLPVAWKGHRLCWITETGGVRYVSQDVNTIEAEHACAKAIDLAAAVQEYAAAMESAPVLEAKGLESGFCLLSEFNNVVLAGHQTQHGTQFITWVWDNNHTSLNFGCYYMLDYKGAKEASVPVVLHHDHGLTDRKIVVALRLEFSYIMYDRSTDSHENNVRQVARMQPFSQVLIPGELVQMKGGNTNTGLWLRRFLLEPP